MNSKCSKPTIVTCFSSCNDPRTHRIEHSLENIIVITLLGVLSGEEGWEGYVELAQEREDWLKTFLKLPNGIPSPDTVRRVIERINPQEFLNCFIAWAESINTRLAGQICIDGKTLKKATYKGGVLHLVSAWAESNRLVLGSISSLSKGKEIPSIEKLLDVLVFKKGDIVSIDAIGCQTNIVEKIRSQKADYVIAVKANQGSLYDELLNFFLQAEQAPTYAPVDIQDLERKGHGRIDCNKIWKTADIKWLPQVGDWKGLKSLVMVHRQYSNSKGELKEERRFYISSLDVSPEMFANLIRRHWSIENEYHWHLDVTFKEDDSKIGAVANANLRVMRTIALNLLRNEGTPKKSLKSKMRKCCRSDAFLASVLML